MPKNHTAFCYLVWQMLRCPENKYIDIERKYIKMILILYFTDLSVPIYGEPLLNILTSMKFRLHSYNLVFSKYCSLKCIKKNILKRSEKLTTMLALAGDHLLKPFTRQMKFMLLNVLIYLVYK